MGDRTEIAFRRAAIALIPDGAAVVAAVSGGADSVALLHLLSRLEPLRGWRLTAAHLDHGLRRGSAADRRFVERLCARLGVPCRSDRRDVGAERRRDESPEEAARRVRRAFLLEAAHKARARHVALGHTLDDQAETILMRLARGGGPLAISGMAASGPGPFVRPLLGIERDAVREWLARRDLPFREDPSNRSLRFDRNRLRARVMPLLADTLNPRAARHVVEAAGRLREDAVLLDALAEEAYARIAARRRGTIVLRVEELAAMAPALARRVARLALGRAGCDPRRIATRHIEALLSAARGGRARLDLPDGVKAEVRDGRIRLRHP